MHEAKTTEMPLTEFRARIDSELRSRGFDKIVPQMYDEIVVRSGLFRIVGDNISFRHHILQEFFAGRGIQRADFVTLALGDEWWKLPLVFYFGQNPGDVASLQQLSSNVATMASAPGFRAAVTLGLAIQACYLSTVDDKAALFRSVLYGLVLSRCGSATFEALFQKFPISVLVSSYLYARDAVGIRTLSRFSDTVSDELDADASLTDRQREDAEFWLIAGLIESNAWHEAEKRMKAFHPKEPMYLLSLLLGVAMAAEMRASSPAEKKFLKTLGLGLGRRVGRTGRTQIMDRYQTELIEIQRGDIVGIQPKYDYEASTSPLAISGGRSQPPSDEPTEE
jgi:hypothetical protein